MIEVNTIRRLLRIEALSPELSVREKSRLAQTSHQSVLRTRNRAQKAELTYASSEQLTDDELLAKMYPKLYQTQLRKREPPYEGILKEALKKQGKTLVVQYLEYRVKDPETAYGKTQFFRLVRQFLKTYKLSMRQKYMAGEVVFIDYAGTKLKVIQNGKTRWLKVFVACLGASRNIFALATPYEKTVDWLRGLEQLFETLGGVPEVVVIDNAKALVTKPGLTPVLVKNLELLAIHYGCIIDACRVGAPQDKGLVEQAVKFVTQRAIVPMNADMNFYSIEEANCYLAKAVAKLNELPMQKLNVSRAQLFDELEKPALHPLPNQPFSILQEYKLLQVPDDYHIEYGGHWYSVPWQLAHKQVELLVDQSQLKVVYQNQVQAVHSLNYEMDGQTTLPEHMPPQHKAESLKTKDHYLHWAQEEGIYVDTLVQRHYAMTRNSNSRAIGKRCQALMKLSAEHGCEIFSAACQYALENDMINPSEIKLIISAKAYETPANEYLPGPHLYHQHIRGKSYYGGCTND